MHYWDAPNEVGAVYLVLFTSVLALVVLAYLIIAIVFPKVANKYAILVLELITMILWIGSFASIGYFTGDFCNNRLIRREKKCREFIVATVFGALSW